MTILGNHPTWVAALAAAVTISIAAPCPAQQVMPRRRHSSNLTAGSATLAAAPEPARASLLVGSAREMEAGQAIEAALDRSVSIAFDQTPLEGVAAALQERLRVPVRIDSRALADAGAAADTPITYGASGISARAALKALLAEHQLAWVISGEFLEITSEDAAKNHLATRVYPVLDLVLIETPDAYDMDFDSLIELITSTIAPVSWDSAGGAGAIAPFEASGALVCSQTREVHERIEGLLARLREARHLQHIPTLTVGGAQPTGETDDDNARGNQAGGAFNVAADAAGDQAETPTPARAPAATPANRASAARPAWRIPRVYR